MGAVDSGIELIGKVGVVRTMGGGSSVRSAVVSTSGMSSSVVSAVVSTSGISSVVSTSGIRSVGRIVVMASNGVLHLVHESRHDESLFVSGYSRRWKSRR
jgi:hypothetical protein